jgi:hypothetical protein
MVNAAVPGFALWVGGMTLLTLYMILQVAPQQWAPSILGASQLPKISTDTNDPTSNGGKV